MKHMLFFYFLICYNNSLEEKIRVLIKDVCSRFLDEFHSSRNKKKQSKSIPLQEIIRNTETDI